MTRKEPVCPTCQSPIRDTAQAQPNRMLSCRRCGYVGHAMWSYSDISARSLCIRSDLDTWVLTVYFDDRPWSNTTLHLDLIVPMTVGALLSRGEWSRHALLSMLSSQTRDALTRLMVERGVCPENER